METSYVSTFSGIAFWWVSTSVINSVHVGHRVSTLLCLFSLCLCFLSAPLVFDVCNLALPALSIGAVALCFVRWCCCLAALALLVLVVFLLCGSVLNQIGSKFVPFSFLFVCLILFVFWLFPGCPPYLLVVFGVFLLFYPVCPLVLVALYGELVGFVLFYCNFFAVFIVCHAKLIFYLMIDLENLQR